MYGWTGKILHLDLTLRRHTTITLAPEIYSTRIGGKGLAGYFLGQKGALDWDDPDLPLCFFTGPLVATIAPTSGRGAAMCRSPLTNAVADASVGGAFATALKRAGWDGFVATGMADGLCGIEIRDSQVTFHDARHLAGYTTDKVVDACTGKGATLSIGPAAENRVRFASLGVDRHHAAGRGGLGLCFAARNLKYVTAHGTGRVKVYDPAGLKAARAEIMRLTAASPVLMGQHGFVCYGTGALFDLMHSRRMMPTDNFTTTRFDHAPEVNAAVFKARFQPEKHGCKGCHIFCKRVAASGRAMPEFETMSHFTALVGNLDPELVVAANHLCNTLGMDTITAAATLACYREIEGRDFKPGEILALLDDIGHARGVGRELGQGSLRFAASRGRPETSMSAKGLEFPAYDPRGAYGMALGYAVATRGGCHLRAYPISHEILRKPVATDRFTFSGKARIIKISEDLNAVVDSLTACKFVFFAASLEEYAKAFTAVTGQESTAQDLLAAGERIYYNERILNARYGLDARHDDLPARFFDEPGASGEGIDITPLNRADFLDARARYYRIRGLDENGRPRADVAERLGLEWKEEEGQKD